MKVQAKILKFYYDSNKSEHYLVNNSPGGPSQSVVCKCYVYDMNNSKLFFICSIIYQKT